MRILSVGVFQGLSNTCLHRHWALQKIADQVDTIAMDDNPDTFLYKICFHLYQDLHLPIRVPDNCNENRKIIESVSKNIYDIVWIDKGLNINLETLLFIHKIQPDCKIISYSPDNMALRHNQTLNYIQSLPAYDFVVTNKSYIIDDLKTLGAKKVFFVNNSFETSFHFPRVLNNDDLRDLGGDIGFVGAWEQDRADSILFLAKNGLNVRVFGNKPWLKYRGLFPNLIIENHGLVGENYAKSFRAFKISLCFLRKMNFDVQTTRSVEIPACGGFMMAERTKEHKALFRENEEAVYFSTNEELLEKCKYYLQHEKERIDISIAGYKRCMDSDYSNEGMVRRVLSDAFNRTQI